MPAGAHTAVEAREEQAKESQQAAAAAAGKGTKISVPWEWGISSTPNLSIASPLRSRRDSAACIALSASVLLLLSSPPPPTI
jgi:hypothetical protein